MNYHECLREIDSFQGRGIHRGLERVEKACRLLGMPQDRYPSLHIAGTNGKGSTAAMTAEILKRAHFKTGLTISPHIENFRERIQINGQWIPKEELERIHILLKKKVGHLSPTYFEWGVLMAFQFFAESRVDMAVLETGMGGRWDATNVAHPLIGAITNISLDHEAWLGTTLEEILAEKMEILKPGMVAWTGIDNKGLLFRLDEYCRTKGISLHRLDDYFRSHMDDTFSMFDYRGLRCGLAGEHQKRNAALAVAITRSLSEKGYRIPRQAVEEGIEKVNWPCRLETAANSPVVILDGAHNRGGIAALAHYLKNQGRKFHLVFATLKDRPFEEMIAPLIPFALDIRWALFDEPRALSREELGEKVKALSGLSRLKQDFLAIEPLPWQDFCRTIPSDEPVLVTGSLYLASRVRAMLKK